MRAPTQAGDNEVMNNGDTYTAINHPKLGLVWDLHPQHHEEKKQKFLVQAKQWLERQPDEHHHVIRSFVNKILKDPNKHLRVGQDDRDGPTMPRFRHLTQMVTGHPDTSLTVHSPNSLSLQVKRHSHTTANEGVSNFNFDLTNNVVKSEDFWYNGIYGLYKDETGNDYRFFNENGLGIIKRGKESYLGKDETGNDQLDGASALPILKRIQPLLKCLRSGSAVGISDAGSDESDNDPFQSGSQLEKGEKVHSGIMVALPIPMDAAEKIAIADGESPDELHATLLYIPKIGDDEEAFYKIAAIVSEAAKLFAPVKSKISGLGRFSASKSSDGKDVFYAGFDASVLPELRQYIFDKVKDAGFEWESKFGFTPHVTLKYIGTEDELPKNRLESEEFTCGKIIVKSKSFKEEEEFTGDRIAKSDQLSDHFSSLLKSGDGGGKFIHRQPDQHSNRFGSEWYKKSKKDKRIDIQPKPESDKIPLKNTIADAVASVLKPKIQKEELDKGALPKTAGVRSPQPSHTIATLQNLQAEGWRNGNTGYEMSAEEGTNDLHQKLQNKADKALPRTLKDIYGPKKPSSGPEDFFGKDELEKGKNIRQERARVFGTSGEPSPDKKSTKPFHAAQSAALNTLAQKRYGVSIAPAKGKLNYTVPKLNRERKKQSLPPMTEQDVRNSPDFEFANPSVTSGPDANNFRPKQQKTNPKPDWRSGNLEAQRHVAAQAHEMGHLETLPENVSLGDAQTLMDVGTSTVGKKFGAAAKQTQYEIQPMAAEEALRRRAGIPQFGRPQRTDPRRGNSSVPLSADSPPRISLDTKEPYARRQSDAEGLYDRIGSGQNLSRENVQRMNDVDRGITSFDPGKGWTPSNSSNALINLRGMGRTGEATRRLRDKYAPKMGKSENLNKADEWKSSYEQHLPQANKLVHYSKKAGLKTLDPTFQGTGAPSEEYKHGLPAIPRTYFYQHGTQPEDIVTQGAVAKYTANLKPEQKIYDLAHDQDNIHGKLKEASMSKQVNPGVVNSDDFLHAIKSAGYHGFKNTKGSLPNVVALFHAHDIDSEEKP